MYKFLHFCIRSNYRTKCCYRTLIIVHCTNGFLRDKLSYNYRMHDRTSGNTVTMSPVALHLNFKIAIKRRISESVKSCTNTNCKIAHTKNRCLQGIDEQISHYYSQAYDTWSLQFVLNCIPDSDKRSHSAPGQVILLHPSLQSSQTKRYSMIK